MLLELTNKNAEDIAKDIFSYLQRGHEDKQLTSGKSKDTTPQYKLARQKVHT